MSDGSALPVAVTTGERSQMIGTVIFIVFVWGIVLLVAAIPGVAIGWLASGMLGYRWGIAVSVMVAVFATIVAIEIGFPGAYLSLPPLLVVSLLGVWISRRKLRVRKGLSIATALVLTVAYGGPLLLTYIMNGEQDECSFGPVSNSQYRDYLRRAKELSSTTPGDFTDDPNRASARFNELFSKLIDGKPSVYERVAASHALLRSFGAQYRNTSDMRPDTYDQVAKLGGFVLFGYYVNIHRLGVGLFNPLLLFWPRTYVFAHLTGPRDFKGPDASSVGDIRFTVIYPVFDIRQPLDRAPENCPLVPSQSLSDSFSRASN
jgi:hypothetical protein